MKKITLLTLIALCTLGVFAQTRSNVENGQKTKSGKNNIFSEKAPGLQNSQRASESRAIWSLQFAYDVIAASAAQAGCETDGSFIYTTIWSNDTIIKYDLDGNFVEKFKIPGVTGLRDLAYDGTYFYGGAAAGSIYKMDFGTKTLVATIACPAGITVRSIAYDTDRDGLWVGNWGTALVLLDASGAILDSVPAASHGLTGMYGSAYDNWSANGPYLWVFDQGGNEADIVQIDLNTKMPTGVVRDVTLDLGSDIMAAGLFTHENLINGTVTLGGLVQNQIQIFGYNLSVMFEPVDMIITDILSPSNDTTCQLSVAELITIALKNNGTDPAYDFEVFYAIDGGSPVSELITDTLAPNQSMEFTFASTVDLSANPYHSIQAWVVIDGDADTTNNYIEKEVMNATAMILLQLTTDQYAGETSWELVSATTGLVVESGSGYQANTAYDITICADSSECYSFFLYDSYGDGIDPPGGFSLYWDGNLIAMDTAFTGSVVEVLYFGSCSHLPPDLALEEIVSPVNGTSCSLTDSEQVILKIKNVGPVPVSNYVVSYSLDGATPVEETVTATIELGQTYLHTFAGTIDLTANDSYVLEASVVATNDSDPNNDVALTEVFNASGSLLLQLTTDQYASEISWELKSKTTTQVVASGSGYANNTTYDLMICVDANDCYQFDMKDSYGDGILSPGGFTLAWNGTQIASVYNFNGSIYTVDYIGVCIDSLPPQSWAMVSDNLVPAGSPMPIEVPVTDQSQVSIVRAIYTINSVTDSINMAPATTPGNWAGTIPAQSAGNGTVKFFMQDEWGNFGTSSDYAIQWVVVDEFTLNFEASANFSKTFTPWIAYDGDQANTYGFQNVSFPGSGEPMAFMAFNPAATNPPLTGANIQPYAGERFGASFASVDVANNDWIISPKVTLNDNYKFNFWAKSFVADYGLERFKVGVSTTNTSPASFTFISGTNYIEADTVWTYYSYDLSAYNGQAVHVAINCVSDDAFIFMIDNLAIEISDNVAEIQQAEINMYPNPANSKLNIAANQLINKVTIINALGQVVYITHENRSFISINTSDFNSGLYFVKLETESGVITKRFTVTR